MTTGIQVLDALNVTSKMIHLEQELWTLSTIKTTLDAETRTYCEQIGYALHKLHEHLTELAGATEAAYPMLRCMVCREGMVWSKYGSFTCPICETHWTPIPSDQVMVTECMKSVPHRVRAIVDAANREQFAPHPSQAFDLMVDARFTPREVLAWWMLEGREVYA